MADERPLDEQVTYRVDEAIALLDCLTSSDTLAPFLTVPA